MKEYGFAYEASFISYTKYFSDGGGEWNVGSFENVLQQISNCKAGNRIQILVHPVWWGKK